MDAVLELGAPGTVPPRVGSASVAMATLNGAPYLESQLSSIASQTKRPDELIVSDDGSTDATLEILDRFRRGVAFRVTVLPSHERLGAAANFENAMQSCTADAIFLCDQDDVWEPMKIERVMAEFSAGSCAQVVMHDLEFCDSGLNPIGQRKIERVASFADVGEAYSTGAAMAVRREFFRLAMPRPRLAWLGHDEWLGQCAALVGCKRIVPEALAKYRRHGGNATAGGTLNAPRITTRDDFRRGSLRSDPRPSLRTRVQLSQALGQWVATRARDLVVGGCIAESSVDTLLELQRRKVAAGEARLRALDSTGWARIPSVAALYARGGYRTFSGLGSALKDLTIE